MPVYKKEAGFLFFILSMAVFSPIAAHAAIADFYQEPGLYPNRDYINQNASEHIDPFTGSLQRHYVDVFVPGNGSFDLKVVRSYNSSSVSSNPGASDTLIGVGWTMHFGRVLKSGQATVFWSTCSGLIILDTLIGSKLLPATEVFYDDECRDVLCVPPMSLDSALVATAESILSRFGEWDEMF